MRIPKFLIFVLTLFVISPPLYAANILGKAVVYKTFGIETYPLISGNKISYEYEALIKIPGGTLITDKGTILEAFDEGEHIPFRIERGGIYFRILPEKVSVSFITHQGEISTPKAVTTIDSIVAGGVIVTDKDTRLEVNEGSLDVLTSNDHTIGSVSGAPLERTSDGLTRVNAGQAIILAKKPVAEEQDNEASPPGQPEDRPPGPPSDPGGGKPDDRPIGNPGDRPPDPPGKP